MKLTVAVCTYNPDRQLLLRAVGAIVSQLPSSAELLVIDNNSSPSLAETRALDGYPLRLIRESRQGLTAARERAIEDATGDVILFADDDNILENGYLTTVVAGFE